MGCLPYAEALALQQQHCQRLRQEAGASPTVLLLSHPPTLTLGRSASAEQLVQLAAWPQSFPELQYQAVERGGHWTFHNPQQVIAYPLKRFERSSEVKPFFDAVLAWVEASLEALGVRVFRPAPSWGVWALPRVASLGEEPKKVASIGLAVRGWCSFHGVAIQVSDSPRACLEALAGEGLTLCNLPLSAYASLQSLGYAVSPQALEVALEARVSLFLNPTLMPTLIAENP